MDCGNIKRFPRRSPQGSGVVNAGTFLGGSGGVAGGAIAFALGSFVGVLTMIALGPQPRDFRDGIGGGVSSSVCGTLLARADEVNKRSGQLFEPGLIDSPRRGRLRVINVVSSASRALPLRAQSGHIAASHRSATKSAEAQFRKADTHRVRPTARFLWAGN